MLGSESIVVSVSVVDADADKVNAYLPEGEWVHLGSGEIYDSSMRTSRLQWGNRVCSAKEGINKKSAGGPIRAASGNRMPELEASALWKTWKGEAV